MLKFDHDHGSSCSRALHWVRVLIARTARFGNSMLNRSRDGPGSCEQRTANRAGFAELTRAIFARQAWIELTYCAKLA
jgi:hypothetical protein